MEKITFQGLFRSREPCGLTGQEEFMDLGMLQSGPRSEWGDAQRAPGAEQVC